MMGVDRLVAERAREALVLSGWMIFSAAFAYVVMLFAVASYGDRTGRQTRDPDRGRPLVYSLSLAIYCTSWTYFGSVGLAASRGWEFVAIYIGPILTFTLGMPLVRRIVEIAKAERLTSIADFIAARYGKNPIVAALIALISLVGAVPYIALQLKAVSNSVATLVDTSGYAIGIGNHQVIDLPLLVTLTLAFFAVMFGTRHTDATEHQDGLILAIATESVIKLVAFATVGFFVVFVMFDGPWDLLAKAGENAKVTAALAYDTPMSRWLVLTLLSAFAIIMLPRQFHVAVVENRTPGELKMASVLLPLYLVAINLFVLPVAIGGILTFGGSGDADLYVLTLPASASAPLVTLITFIGGFSAATAMVIVASVALSIMLSNDIVLPILLRRGVIGDAGDRQDIAGLVLGIRRGAIFVVMMLGYFYYRSTDAAAGLASIGLLAFAAIAQMAPALIGGLIWWRANGRGAIWGLSVGFAVWIYLLFLPSLGANHDNGLAGTILDFILPVGGHFSAPGSDPFVNAVILSLLANTLAFIFGSLSRNARALERQQAGIFVRNQTPVRLMARGILREVSIGDLKATVARYLGEERMTRTFATYEERTSRKINDSQKADAAILHFTEQVLGSAIGSSSARLVLSLIMQKAEDASADTAFLLDQASEALQQNQGILQTALAQMDQGIAVFDTDNRLSIWNRQFRTLLDLPDHVGQVGFALEDMVAILARRGDIVRGEEAQILRRFLSLDEPFTLVLDGGRRFIEIRSNPMPDRGMVTTCTDITERMAADLALKFANETLEQRVAERTAELTHVNRELAKARAAAEDANLGKTRFFAAAGHDILQPLNAARLYSSSLVERLAGNEAETLVHNMDSALESVETILGAVLDISRLDTGSMKARVTTVPLDDLLRRIETDYQPLARSKNLDLKVMRTSLAVRTDPTLLRRLVQNLVSNAIKYTPRGRVLVGVRRRGNEAVIEVHDTGIGIPASKYKTVFREFSRLDEGARTASGLGLGLSIVDRIARVLNHPVELTSKMGRGTTFRVKMPVDASVSTLAKAEPAPAAAKPDHALEGLSVLCIDNEQTILDGMKVLLTGWGCKVTTARSVQDCIELVRIMARPDAVVADYHLDDGTGIEAIVTLREAYGKPIEGMLVTADRTQDVRNQAEAAGLLLLNKPVKPAALRAGLTRIAGSPKLAAE